jgi:hypothetical protein
MWFESGARRGQTEPSKFEWTIYFMFSVKGQGITWSASFQTKCKGSESFLGYCLRPVRLQGTGRKPSPTTLLCVCVWVGRQVKISSGVADLPLSDHASCAFFVFFLCHSSPTCTPPHVLFSSFARVDRSMF